MLQIEIKATQIKKKTQWKRITGACFLSLCETKEKKEQEYEMENEQESM